MPEAYAIFEGGGVKGTALVGAYSKIQAAGVSFRGYAGASAGAIVAAFAAVGYTPAEMREIMSSLNYMMFLDGQDAITLESLRGSRDFLAEVLKGADAEEIRADIGALLGKLHGFCWPIKTWWHIKKLRTKHQQTIDSVTGQAPQLAALIRTVVSHYGVYGTETFLNWLRNNLNKKGTPDQDTNQVTFGTLYEYDKRLLKVIAADVTANGPVIYSFKNSADIDVARAVQASMSIPFFFRPYVDGGTHLVDGGVISNFPAWMFDDEKEASNEADVPVLGFRLVPDAYAKQPINSFGGYVSGVLRTVLNGTDFLQTRRVSRLGLISIPIPERVTSTKFDIGMEDRDELYFRGQQAADRFLLVPENRALLGL